TAFNLLNAGAAQRVVTFNGAGVGQMKDGTLAGALESNTESSTCQRKRAKAGNHRFAIKREAIKAMSTRA
ncbi:hypothetical protein SAMN05192589_1503, partial [Paracidovorax valerianellae]